MNSVSKEGVIETLLTLAVPGIGRKPDGCDHGLSGYCLPEELHRRGTGSQPEALKEIIIIYPKVAADSSISEIQNSPGLKICAVG